MFIKNDLLEQYGISAEQLHEDAMKSSPHVMIPEVSSIGALIDEMYQKNILMLTPDEREMLQETLQESSEMPTFFVVTNTDRIDGAGVDLLSGIHWIAVGETSLEMISSFCHHPSMKCWSCQMTGKWMQKC